MPYLGLPPCSLLNLRHNLHKPLISLDWYMTHVSSCDISSQAHCLLTARLTQYLARATTLPAELLDLVFSDLDAKDVETCTRVCRRWNAAAWSKTFRELELTNRRKKRTIAVFVNRLQSSPSLGLLQHVRTLKLHGDGVFGVAGMVTVYDVGFVASCMPALNSLSLTKAWLQCSDRICPMKRPLKTLRLHRSSFDLPRWPDATIEGESSGSAFVDLLNTFANTDTLDIIDLVSFDLHRYKKAPEVDPAVAFVSLMQGKMADKLSIEKLVTRSCAKCAPHTVILDLLGSLPLRSLEIEDSPKDINACIRRSGRTLRQIHLRLKCAEANDYSSVRSQSSCCYDRGGDVLFQHTYDMTGCPLLFHVQLTLPINVVERFPKEMVMLADIVKHLPSHVSEVDIHLDALTQAIEAHLDSADWSALDASLSGRSTLGRLRLTLKFSFALAPKHTAADDLKRVKRWLPLSDAKKLIVPSNCKSECRFSAVHLLNSSFLGTQCEPPSYLIV